MSTVCVVGLGYIGLPLASILASSGHDVIGCDTSDHVVSSIRQGRAHFFEPDLDMLLLGALQSGRLRIQSRPGPADYHVIAVPTPVTPAGEPDLSYVRSATSAIAPALRSGDVVVLESTSPVGSTQEITRLLSELRPDLSFPHFRSEDECDIGVAYRPERILPGKIVRELTTTPCIIGGVGARCGERARVLYRSFVTTEIMVTDCRTAELVKLIENSFRDVNIAFANELSLVADKADINVWDVIDLANRHPRVSILQPGAGVGGHCIAVDPWFIVNAFSAETPLLRAAREVNSGKPLYVAEKIRRAITGKPNPIVTCFGLTYKADVEDLRESPAVEIVMEVARMPDVEVLVCDPMVTRLPPSLSKLKNVHLVDMHDGREQASVVAMLVPHTAFSRLRDADLTAVTIVDPVGFFRRPTDFIKGERGQELGRRAY